MGSLPTAPGHDSLAQVHWDVYRRWVLGLRRLLGGGSICCLEESLAAFLEMFHPVCCERALRVAEVEGGMMWSPGSGGPYCCHQGNETRDEEL